MARGGAATAATVGGRIIGASVGLAWQAGIGGGLAVASGAILYAVGHHYESAQHVSVTPTGRGGAQVSMSWRF